MMTNRINESLTDADEIVNKLSVLSHLKYYLKQLCNDPISARPDDFLIRLFNGKNIIDTLKKRGIIIQNEKIVPDVSNDKFHISYKIPAKNFNRNFNRLYSELCEEHIVDENLVVECDCGSACGGDGATNASVNASAPIVPLGNEKKKGKKKGSDVMRRSIYITKEQSEILGRIIKEEAEMGTAFGDFGYDAPVSIKKDDPSMNHKDIMKDSFKSMHKKWKK